MMFRLIHLALLFLTWPIDAFPSEAVENSTVAAMVLPVTTQGPPNANSSTDLLALDFEPDLAWEEFITPGPMAVALLGQLMVISGKSSIDIPLVENAPIGGFKYMRHPESFRASLVQVSNDGWLAFKKAHTNMDKMQLSMQAIPVHVKTAIQLLASAPTEIIRRLLPIPLKHIRSIGQNCVQLSAQTEAKFDELIALMGELLEVTESSRGTNLQKLATIRIELNVTAERKKMTERVGQELKARQAMIDAVVIERRALYDAAVRDIPTGWRAIFQDLGRAAVNIVNYIPQMYMGTVGAVGSIVSSMNAGRAGGAPAGDFQRESTLGLFRNFFGSVNSVKNTVVQALQGKLPSSDQRPAHVLPMVKTLLDQFEKGFQGTRSELTNTAIGFIHEARALMNADVKVQLANIVSHRNNNSKDNGEGLSRIASAFDALLDRMKPLHAQGSASSPAVGLGSGGGSSQFSCTGCNERYKANLQLEALKHAEQRQDQIFQEVMKYHEEMKHLVSSMARLKLNQLSYEEILDLLRQGIDLLSRIRQQWARLIEFFNLISVRTEHLLNQTLTPFLEYAHQAEQMSGELGREERRFFLNLLSEPAIEINRLSYYLHTLSASYFEVSSRFLMHRMAGLPRMLATNNDEQRSQLLAQLWSVADQSQESIKQMVRERRQRSARMIQARKEELQVVVDRLGPPNEIETNAIRGAYQVIPIE